MLLILMRHGIAEDTIPDEARILTPKGRKRTVQMTDLLKKLGLTPDVVLCSPRARATETAEIVCKRMKLKHDAVVTDALDFGASWEHFAGTLQLTTDQRQTPKIILAVGHQPHLGMMATIALAGEDLGMELRKGSCLGLRFDDAIAEAAASLEFYLTPRLARGEF